MTVVSDQLQFLGMETSHLADVVTIEQQVHLHPWTQGNFEDALKSGYTAQILCDQHQQIKAYFVCMPVLDEWHLLDISVASAYQGQGLGHLMMAQIIQLARQQQMQLILLEVRVSNAGAIHLYQRTGFTEIGRRKNYYPVDAHTREDAIMMQLTLSAST